MLTHFSFLRTNLIHYSARHPVRRYSAQSVHPRVIAELLDDHVIGQERAKKILSVAVYNHYNRIRANLQRLERNEASRDEQGTSLANESSLSAAPDKTTEEHVPSEQAVLRSLGNAPGQPSWLNQYAPLKHTHESFLSDQASTGQSPGSTAKDLSTVLEKSNILLIGPTGSGKTLLAKTLANILKVPFSMSDATSFTQAGYVGEDVEMVIQRLLQSCDYDVERAETGIIFIDEIDKIARRSDPSIGSKDVSGEGVQQSLLRMLEGTVIHITDKGMPISSSSSPQRPTPILTGGTMIGSMVAPSSTLPAPPSSSISPSPSTASPSSILRSTGLAPPPGETYAVDTSNILFILSGAFIGLEKIVMDRLDKGSMGFGEDERIPDASLDGSDSNQPGTSVTLENALSFVEPEDTVKYGLIPEFIGRLPIIANVNQLSEDDLLRVLTEPKNALLKQYKELFALSHVSIEFTRKALRATAKRVLETQSGARGLRRIMEQILLEPMYEAPASSIRHILITKDVVEGKSAPLYYSRGQWAVMEEDMKYDDDDLRVRRTSPSQASKQSSRQSTETGTSTVADTEPNYIAPNSSLQQVVETYYRI
ncbi:P-loop containing nucleoside triphosphate hydrolase protein [Radiomyces spectabilis]|uniref:P-loop containing nucleoside triphosphate hydrolase protein n=1 Tax=Radiomyces spectabilis TaxID=64574 RepID=UPI0022200F7E|nr:P-loop containing nucleoside triphosphate hydrolase protein [Radiomyces spectabilis]KAI8369313.1 P-loop containing nucleoside triphosphate hydrolase protein [Radiomyces spectabilis]